MNRIKKTSLITALVSSLIFSAACTYGVLVMHYGSGPLMASGTFVTTITKSPFQNPASTYFVSISKSFTSSAESLLQQSCGTNSSTSPCIGASGGTLQMLYVYSSALDGIAAIYPNLAGTGSLSSSAAVTAGVPLEWDSPTSGVSAPLLLSNTNSLVFTAGTAANGAATTASSTNVTEVGLFP